MQTDKRIIRTKTNIKRAFMELALATDTSKISISELSQKAFVNRSTFYLHYNNVNAVAEDIEMEFSEKIADCLSEFSIANIYISTYTLFKRLTKLLDENEISKRYIIYSTNSSYIIGRLKMIFVERAKQSILNKFPVIPQNKLNYPLIFAAGGIVDSYVNWVKSGGKSISLEDLIREACSITEHIIATITSNYQ